MARTLILPLALALFGAVHHAAAAEPQAIRYLAANCANCHGTDGHAQAGMPRLAGVPKAYLLEELMSFREGKRPATVMHQLSKGYSEAELEGLAEYFSRQQVR